MALDNKPAQWTENGTVWVRQMPDESLEDFVKRAAAARGPLTDDEKIALRDIFAPVLDEPGSNAA